MTLRLELEASDMDLNEKVNAVETRDDFIEFIGALRRDLKSSPDDWQNTTLDGFLEALAAWVQDMDGYYQNNSLPVTLLLNWKNVAEMMLAAKHYE
ncbi:hypothetical protein GWI72_13725 [Microvirga tunisiensis]|uniref:DUF7660 domain-containing protein n=1 Tax=Pannonibacter tanglangensis TaxID=2750084 RepID=A0A7X5F3Z3_9HYPH|nr:hypothetical protein [Pannonibacter sp. XCT-53]NBN79331.1 hypothetical protein [Pannonibacter sp. XCT-53]